MALTVRTTKEFMKAIEAIKLQTNIKAASKIINFCVSNFLPLQEQLKIKNTECQKLTSQLQEVKDILVEKESVDKKYKKMMKQLKKLN